MKIVKYKVHIRKHNENQKDIIRKPMNIFTFISVLETLLIFIRGELGKM